jgi:hypothetical protein
MGTVKMRKAFRVDAKALVKLLSISMIFFPSATFWSLLVNSSSVVFFS